MLYQLSYTPIPTGLAYGASECGAIESLRGKGK